MAEYSRDFGRRLKIRFGTSRDPSNEEIDRWLREIAKLVGLGQTQDVAANQAATSIFPGTGTHVYASEGDTIAALLREAQTGRK